MVHNDWVDVILEAIGSFCFILSGINDMFILGSVICGLIFIFKL